MLKKVKKASVSILAVFLFTAGLTSPAQANNTVTTLEVSGFSVSWAQTMYYPSGCSRFEFKYVNNSPKKFLEVGFELKDEFGGSVASDSLIGAPPGRSGIWDEQICESAVSAGLGPYRIKVYIEDYSSAGGGTLEKYADVYFTKRPGASAPKATNPVPAQDSGAVTTLEVSGFSVSWPKVMYLPSGCSRFEFKYVNNSPKKFLEVGFELKDQFGGSVASDSLIGAPPGRTGIWDEQICKSALDSGVGPYKIKVYIEDYSSAGGGTLEEYSDVYFTQRPTASTSKTTSIKCVKGSQTKTVAGTKPKCPTGWKKK
jgi:hypothetical protein